MRKILYLSITLLVSFFVSLPAMADGVGLTIGFNGVAIDYQKALSPKLNARFMLSDMPLNRETDEEGINYEVKYDRTNIGVLLDYYPMAGTFHLTAGMHALDHNLELKAKSSTGKYEIGDHVYTSNNLSLKGTVAFAKASPYLGLGWGNTIGHTGISGNLDLGVLYIGKPSVSYEASGTISNGSISINVAQYAPFLQDLEKERASVENDLKDITVMPIIQFGITYQF